jgi:hypothetical protein
LRRRPQQLMAQFFIHITEANAEFGLRIDIVVAA